MVTGIVTNVTEKGFGFIRSDELSKDVFFHHSACMEGLDFDTQVVVGMRVQFDVRETEKGLVAQGVVKAEDGAGA